MSRTTGGIFVLLGLLAATALLLWMLEESAEDGGFALDGEATGEQRATPKRAGAETRTSTDSSSDVRERAWDGVPRVLPPDAAIEDVRDALALTDERVRVRALQEAYDAITRLASKDADVRGLQRYVLRVEDPVARGVVFAALGANRGKSNLDYLAARLQAGKSPVERTGAFLGLVYAKAGATARCDAALGGVRHRFGELPTQRGLLAIVAGWLDRETSATAADAIVPLTHLVTTDVDVAALLVVDDKRVCKLYASLGESAREVMRKGALKHTALPGVVRTVLEASR